MSTTGRTQKSRHKGVEECLAALTMIPNESLRDVLLSVPATLGFAGLKVLVPKGKYFC